MSELKKPFKHFDTYALFLSKKIATSSNNNAYTINGGSIIAGTPEILWQDFVLIHDIGQIWNRGRFYNYQKSYNTLAKIAKNTFEPYSGPIVTFIEEDGRDYFVSGGIIDAFKAHNILPSLSIVPSFIENKEGTNSNGTLYPVLSIDKLNSLIDLGCDIVNHSYSHDADIYKSGSNYNEIVDDLKKAEDWFVNHNIFTNCFSYPENIIDDNIKTAASRFEEHAVIYDGVNYLNDYKTDNRSLVKMYLCDSNIAAVKAQIDAAISSNKWIIITTHSCGASSVEDFGSASIYGTLSPSTINNILSYIESKNIRYYNLTDALKVRASEFNINGFKVYKDGDIAFNDNAKDTIMTTVVENLEEYGMYTLEDGQYVTTEKYERIRVTGVGTFFISEGTLEFNATDATKWKNPMMTYIQNNFNFNSMSSETQQSLIQFIGQNWNAIAAASSERPILAD